MFGKILNLGEFFGFADSKTSKIEVRFPDAPALLAKAEKCTESCVLPDQVNVSRDFFQKLAMRAAAAHSITMDEANRIIVLIEYMAKAKSSRLVKAEAMA